MTSLTIAQNLANVGLAVFACNNFSEAKKVRRRKW